MADTGVPEVLDALRDVTYSADKAELVTAARSSGPPEEMVKALRGIPPEQYTRREYVARSVRVDPEQARDGGRPEPSQHLREEPKTPIQEELDD
ncbi:DUF2795 domain-containing protein [Streptomyces sp. NPDC001982]|uniref:DUF2795 domain-containing protein n=1 Tax=Streptomyces sp. NPDC001982 TaxID=3154405 RepID=UPI00332D5CEC